jgi:RNA polymerase sigma factor (sigma-70 family)
MKRRMNQKHHCPPLIDRSPAPRSQAPLGNAFREALLQTGYMLRAREAQLREVHSQAELGNEEQIRKRFASLSSALYNAPCPSQSNHPKFAFRNPSLGVSISNLGFWIVDFGRWFLSFGFRISKFIMTPMSSDGSVTHLIGELKAGKPEALEKLYQFYLPRLLGLARKKLSQSPRMVEDEEDVVQSVFRGFCELVDRGIYPSLQNRNDLWLLLFSMTARKIGRLRRTKRLPQQEGAVLSREQENADDEMLGLEHLLGHEPTPEEAAAFAEEVKRRMDGLQDDVLRQVAQWKMENFTDEEIAQKLGCVTRTVERKLCVIRNTWENMGS